MHVSDPNSLSLVSDHDVDNRSDDEISSQLKTFCAPTDSNKNVWAYWSLGYDQMPPWNQRNVINWIRRLGSSWTVRVLDSVPGSPTNVFRFVDQHFFPETFKSGKTSGPYVGVHSGDLVRLPLLQLYGGVWMDVGTILIRHLDDIWKVIEDPSTPYELAGMTLPLRPNEEIMLNGFLVTLRNNEYIKRWHQIYLALWINSTESLDFHAHPILRHMRLYAPSSIFQIPSEVFTDYLAHMLCGERLRDLIDSSDGFNGRLYYESKVYLLPSFREMFYFQKRTGWDGNKEFEILATRYDVSELYQDERFHHAKDIVHDTLQNTFLIKFSHGPKGASGSWLADIWDNPRHHNADNEPGTFAFYLRQKLLQSNQTRQLRPITVTPLTAKVWNAGLVEPCQGCDL